MKGDASDILLSLGARHAHNVFSGRKTVEIRRRRINVPIGTRVWIYAKLPVGAVLGFATITNIENRAPASLWRRYGSESAIEKSEFNEYLEGRDSACALVLDDVALLSDAVPLAVLRKLEKKFRPPQFFSKLNGLAKPLRRAATRSKSRLNQPSASP